MSETIPLELEYAPTEPVARRDAATGWIVAAALLGQSLAPIWSLTSSVYALTSAPTEFASYALHDWLWTAEGPVALFLATLYLFWRGRSQALRRWSLAVAIYGIYATALCVGIIWRGSMGQPALGVIAQVSNAFANAGRIANAVVFFAPALLLDVRDPVRWSRRALLLCLIAVLFGGMSTLASLSTGYRALRYSQPNLSWKGVFGEMLADSYPTANVEPFFAIAVMILLLRALRRPEVHARSVRLSIATMALFAVAEFLDREIWAIPMIGLRLHLRVLNTLNATGAFWARWTFVILAQGDLWAPTIFFLRNKKTFGRSPLK